MNYQNYRPLNFGEIPFITKNIILINVALFILSNYLIKNINLNEYLNLYTYDTGLFRPHQLISHIFMHADFRHLLFNMFGLYLFGSKLENLWGPKRYVNFYLFCGIIAGLSQFALFYYNHQSGILLGASGAIAGLLGATGYLFPNSEIGLFMFPPIKYKYFIPIYFLASWYNGFISNNNDHVAHIAHLGGLVTGIIVVFIWNKKNKDFY